MKRKSENERINELVDYIKNFEMYQKLFDDVDRDIHRSLEREKKKRINSGKGCDPSLS